MCSNTLMSHTTIPASSYLNRVPTPKQQVFGDEYLKSVAQSRAIKK